MSPIVTLDTPLLLRLASTVILISGLWVYQPHCAETNKTQLFYKHVLSKRAIEDVTAHQLHQWEEISSVRAVLRVILSELT